MECDYHYGWTKKNATYTKISPKMVKPTHVGRNAEEQKQEEEKEEEELQDPYTTHCIKKNHWGENSGQKNKQTEYNPRKSVVL